MSECTGCCLAWRPRRPPLLAVCCTREGCTCKPAVGSAARRGALGVWYLPCAIHGLLAPAFTLRSPMLARAAAPMTPSRADVTEFRLYMSYAIAMPDFVGSDGEHSTALSQVSQVTERQHIQHSV